MAHQEQYEQTKEHREDLKTLHGMGYAQELSRRMGPFQNFAISFSIICILAGGITAFPLSLSAAGGASVGYGWPLACLFALLVAAAMGQIASAYPTAGGIYHWASLMGGRGYGWAAAWFNLLGLMFVVSSVNFGVFLLFRDLFLGSALGMDVSDLDHKGVHGPGLVDPDTVHHRHHRDAGNAQPLRHPRHHHPDRLQRLSYFRRSRCC